MFVKNKEGWMDLASHVSILDKVVCISFLSNGLWERLESIYYSTSYEKIVGYTTFSRLIETIDLGESRTPNWNFEMFSQNMLQIDTLFFSYKLIQKVLLFVYKTFIGKVWIHRFSLIQLWVISVPEGVYLVLEVNILKENFWIQTSSTSQNNWTCI